MRQITNSLNWLTEDSINMTHCQVPYKMVKFSLSMPSRHTRRAEVQLRSLSTLALGGSEWLTSCPGHFISAKESWYPLAWQVSYGYVYNTAQQNLNSKETKQENRAASTNWYCKHRRPGRILRGLGVLFLTIQTMCTWLSDVSMYS
jgi:hypothetical protein